MLFLFLYKSFAYLISKSPIYPDWAFYVNSRVPRLIFDQCSTLLISTAKQVV